MINNTVIQKLYEAVRLPMEIFTDSISEQNYSSGQFHPNPAVSIISIVSNSVHQVCYTISPEYLYYGLVRIHNSSKYLVVGPAIAIECSKKQAQNILTNLKQPFNRTEELMRWLHQTPLCDISRFRGILCLIDYMINGASENEAVHIPYQVVPSPAVKIENYPSQIEQVSDLSEKELLSYIEFGNTTAVEILLKDMESQAGIFSSLAPDATRSFKNYFIFSIGIVSRAAMKGGLDYSIASAIQGSYLNQIENLDSYTDIFNLLKQMYLDYTRRTSRYRSLLTDSPVVNKIHKDVHAHLYEKITPTILSEHLRMNCSYLCRHFKQETGKTISGYINEIKIQECIRLLEATGMSLIQISEQLGFSSQNYLHTVFKKVTGMTPMEYRNKA
jgi:AraC-like DNA-binding protein